MAEVLTTRVQAMLVLQPRPYDTKLVRVGDSGHTKTQAPRRRVRTCTCRGQRIALAHLANQSRAKKSALDRHEVGARPSGWTDACSDSQWRLRAWSGNIASQSAAAQKIRMREATALPGSGKRSPRKQCRAKK